MMSERELSPLVAGLLRGGKALRFSRTARLSSRRDREAGLRFVVGKIIAAFLLAAINVFLIAALVQSQDCPSCSVPAGVVEGRVFDFHGRPAAGVTVYAEKVNLEKGVIPRAKTNRNGFFHLLTGPGKYKIYAGREASGHPETLSRLYGDAVQYRDVTVKVDEVTAVTLRLGPRFGTLILRLIDSSNGKPLSGASFTMRFTRDYPYETETSLDGGRFKILVPPVPIMIDVSEPGYETNHLGPITIPRAKTKRIAVSLRPNRQ